MRNKYFKHSLQVSKVCWAALFTLVFSFQFAAFADDNPTNSAPLPGVQVQEDSLTQYPDKEGATELVNPQMAACQAILVNEDIESRYKKIQDALEADYAQGMPKQLKTDLVRVRDDIDGLSVKLFEVDTSNSQEVNHIIQLTIDYLEKMISHLPDMPAVQFLRLFVGMDLSRPQKGFDTKTLSEEREKSIDRGLNMLTQVYRSSSFPEQLKPRLDITIKGGGR